MRGLASISRSYRGCHAHVRMSMLESILGWAVMIGTLVTAPLGAQEPTVDSLLERSKAVLAQHAGNIALDGLKDRVEVIRDRWGVPHIYAKNQDDLFFAQGFIAAQDRLWQIDMWRRIGVGETAEVLGQSGVAGDRFARLVRYRGDMQAEWTSYSPDTQQIAVAFTRGINAYIAHIGDRLPIEFQLLKYRPGLWKPEDILTRMSGIIMCRNFRSEVDRARLIAAVGLDKARWLAPTDPAREFALDRELDAASLPASIFSGYEAATKALDFARVPPGSNNWVVDATRSASGKPLLASDPHRSLALPSLRYLVHLNAPGWNVIGGGEPALPGVAIGHNDHVAWGMTIVGTDQADVFVEQTKPDAPDQVRRGDQWEKLTIIRETIKVRGAADVELELSFSSHGPIMHQDRDKHRAYALRWSGAEPGTAGYLGCLALNRVNNARAFLKEAARWKLPSENLVFADVDGNIGWIAAALTPVRQGFDGLLPVPGWNEKYRWTGFLPSEQLPQVFNPPRHYVATANHNILPSGYGREIAYEFAPPFRYQRCDERLRGASKFTIDDFKTIQHDNTNIAARRFAAVVSQVKLSDSDLQPYAKSVAQWDGAMVRESQAAPIFAAWSSEALRELFRPHVSADLLDYCTSGPGLELMLDALEKLDARWLGSNPTEARAQLLERSLRRAVAQLDKRLGHDLATWSWGRLHQAHFTHSLGSLGEAYAQAFSPPAVATPGDVNSPNNARYDKNYRHIHGASFRLLVDLADWDLGQATSTPGQSGQPGSPHYADLLPLWKEGRYFPLLYSRSKIEGSREHTLILQSRSP